MNSFQFSPFPVLVTENLLLRQLAISDAPDILELRSNEQVNKYLNRNKASSLEDALTFIALINKSIANNESIYWGLQLKDDLRIIGTICLWNLSRQDNKGELGYELLPEYQGRGFMQQAISEIIDYAFKIMDIKTIEAWTVSQNLASIRILEKNGFVINEEAYGVMTEEERKAGNIVYTLQAID